MNVLTGGLEAIAKGPQLRAGPVGHIAAIVDAVVNLLLQVGVGAQLLHQPLQDRQILRRLGIDGAAQLTGAIEGGGNGQQLFAAQQPLAVGALYRRANVANAPKVQAIVMIFQPSRLLGFGQQPQAGGLGVGGHQALGGQGAYLSGGKGRQMLAQARPLQQV